jgi:hypothetical protein
MLGEPEGAAGYLQAAKYCLAASSFASTIVPDPYRW